MAITKRYRTFDKSWKIEMLLEQLRTVFRKPALAATLGAALVTGSSTAANAEEAQCAPLKKTNWGQDLGASSSAHMYSEDNIGSVGISIFPGADLETNGFTADELGTTIVSALSDVGVNAQCYVHKTQFPESGTALGFKVAGLSIVVDGDESFNMAQVWNDGRILQSTIAEAKTAGQLLAGADIEQGSQPLVFAP